MRPPLASLTARPDLLWLLAGHLLPGGWAIVFSVAVFAVVALAPFVHHGGTTYANVFGPLIGGVFALGISRGYLELLREAASRESTSRSRTRGRVPARGPSCHGGLANS